MIVNGHGGDAPVDAVAAHAAAVAQVRQFVNTVMAVTVNGMIHSGPGIPGEMIIESACEALGEMIGSMYMGDEAIVLAFRRKCRDAFSKSLREAPVRAAPRPVDLGASIAAMETASRKQ